MDFEKLMQQPESARNDQWEREFLDAILSMKVEVQKGGDPLTGPDGWPYLSVRTGRGDEPVEKVVRWLAGRGIGMVVNAFKMAPDYVFTYGMLWNFIESGRFARSNRPEVKHKTPADGKVAGFARIDGREVGIVSNDFTVLGASSAVMFGALIALMIAKNASADTHVGRFGHQ